MQAPDSPLAISQKDFRLRPIGDVDLETGADKGSAARMFRRAGLYYHTIRHLKPAQILGRVKAASKKRLTHNRQANLPAAVEGHLEFQVPAINHDSWNSPEQIRAGHFCFLNRQQRLGRPINWNVADAPLLWQFNLHYFNYLHLLEQAEQIKICRDWIGANPFGREPAWHPYPTSLRLVNWCKANLDAPDISRSIYEQAAYLHRNLETYHPGNHLLENARALVFAGSYFGGLGDAPVWLNTGLGIFRTETPNQVLTDGGHFERSPMYHALMLAAYLDVINLLDRDDRTRSMLAETARRMCDFLYSVTHPSGGLALFNDSTAEIAPATETLLSYAGELIGHTGKKKTSFPESGYFVHQNDDVYLVIDGGPIGPHFMPAHAHADIFSFELSLKALPFIVDSGVHDYENGAMRQYVRSTRAHNTVVVDRVDQAECWDRFRVARRFDPKDVAFTTSEAGSSFEGSFDGYAKLIGDGIVHHRRVTCLDSHRTVHVEDTVAGRGKHLVESMLHLHPSIVVHREGNSLKLKNGSVDCLFQAEDGDVAIENGWYCPRFGVKEGNSVIAIRAETNLPVKLAYSLTY
jgi:uncharacterized heparinase superfamily protein